MEDAISERAAMPVLWCHTLFMSWRFHEMLCPDLFLKVVSRQIFATIQSCKTLLLEFFTIRPYPRLHVHINVGHAIIQTFHLGESNVISFVLHNVLFNLSSSKRCSSSCHRLISRKSTQDHFLMAAYPSKWAQWRIAWLQSWISDGCCRRSQTGD